MKQYRLNCQVELEYMKCVLDNIIVGFLSLSEYCYGIVFTDEFIKEESMLFEFKKFIYNLTSYMEFNDKIDRFFESEGEYFEDVIIKHLCIRSCIGDIK